MALHPGKHEQIYLRKFFAVTVVAPAHEINKFAVISMRSLSSGNTTLSGAASFMSETALSRSFPIPVEATMQ